MSKKETADYLIIDTPSVLRRSERLAAGGVTLAFWLAMFYLWQPLISLVAWLFNTKLFYEHMIVLGGFRGFMEVLVIYLAVILFLGGGLIFWAKLNQWRFRGKEKRTLPPKASPEQIAEFFVVDSEQLKQWQSIKNARVYFDQGNHVARVESNEPEGVDQETS
ncbi:conserved hypothetical protein [gamma proteobacterium HTCC5015]|nr:conserved hypothetical protein [gamma proteobacterium HTCC5015]